MASSPQETRAKRPTLDLLYRLLLPVRVCCVFCAIVLPAIAQRFTWFFLRVVGYPNIKSMQYSPDAHYAFWDFSSQPYALGDIITWHVRICVEAISAGKHSVVIFVLSDALAPSSKLQSDTITTRNFKSYLSELFPAFMLNPMLGGIDFTMDRYVFEQHFFSLAAQSASVSPSVPTFAAAHSASLGLDVSHRPIIEHFQKTGTLPRAQVPQSVRNWAKSFLGNYTQKFVLCIHVRNRRLFADAASTRTDISRDGVPEAWTQFLLELNRKYPEVLVLALGKPGEWPREFFRIPNLVVIKSLGFGLLEEMAMIEECDMFLGTVSGPAEYAYFGVKPYIIVDAPSNNARSATIRCIPEDQRRSPWATEHQRLYVGTPDGGELLRLFESIYLPLTSARSADEGSTSNGGGP